MVQSIHVLLGLRRNILPLYSLFFLLHSSFLHSFFFLLTFVRMCVRASLYEFQLHVDYYIANEALFFFFFFFFFFFVF